MNSLTQVCEKAYLTEKAKGIPKPDILKQYLQDFLNKDSNENVKKPFENTLFGLIERFIDNEIKHKGKRKSDNTLKAYRTARKSLGEFETHIRSLPESKGGDKNFKMDFEAVTLDFFL